MEISLIQPLAQLHVPPSDHLVVTVFQFHTLLKLLQSDADRPPRMGVDFFLCHIYFHDLEDGIEVELNLALFRVLSLNRA